MTIRLKRNYTNTHTLVCLFSTSHSPDSGKYVGAIKSEVCFLFNVHDRRNVNFPGVAMRSKKKQKTNRMRAEVLFKKQNKTAEMAIVPNSQGSLRVQQHNSVLRIITRYQCSHYGSAGYEPNQYP